MLVLPDVVCHTRLQHGDVSMDRAWSSLTMLLLSIVHYSYNNNWISHLIFLFM